MQAAYQPEFSTAGFYELANSGREVYSMNPAWRFHKGTATGVRKPPTLMTRTGKWFPALYQIQSFYKDNSPFGIALHNEIELLNSDLKDSITKYNFINYYQSTYNKFLLKKLVKVLLLIVKLLTF